MRQYDSVEVPQGQIHVQSQSFVQTYCLLTQEPIEAASFYGKHFVLITVENKMLKSF